MVEKDRVGCAGNGKVHINITQDDIRGLTSQFKGNLLQIIRGSLDDQLANFCRAGISDLVIPGMSYQWRTRLFTESGDDIHHPVGESRFLDNLPKKQSG